MASPAILSEEVPPRAFDYDALPVNDREYVRHLACTIRSAVKTTVDCIQRVGESLACVKKRIGHGHLSGFVEVECGFSLRTAENYIRAAEFISRNATVAILPAAAIYKLSARSTPREIVSQVVDRIKSGNPPTPSEIDVALSHHRRRRRMLQIRKAGSRPSNEFEMSDIARPEHESLRLKAIEFINVVGKRHAWMAVDLLCGIEGWRIGKFIRDELKDREYVDGVDYLAIPQFLRRPPSL
jgi:hypothetical protein